MDFEASNSKNMDQENSAKKEEIWEFHISSYGLTGYMYDC